LAARRRGRERSERPQAPLDGERRLLTKPRLSLATGSQSTAARADTRASPHPCHVACGTSRVALRMLSVPCQTNACRSGVRRGRSSSATAFPWCVPGRPARQITTMVSTSKAYESAGPLLPFPPTEVERPTLSASPSAPSARTSRRPPSRASPLTRPKTTTLPVGQLEHHKLCYVPLPASDDPDFDTPSALTGGTPESA